MDKFLKYYEIPVSGLKQGIHTFDFEIEKEFFSYFDCEEFEDVSFKVRLEIDKSSTMLIMNFHFDGFVEVNCDICGDLFKLNLQNKFRLIGKFSNQEGDDGDEIVYIPYDESRINLAQHLYEFILLAVPAKRVHPAGKCNPQTLQKLRQYIVETPAEEAPDEDELAEEEDNKAVWELLRKLKNDNKR